MRHDTRMMMAAMSATLGTVFSPGTTQIIGKRIGRKGWSASHQGAQEMARRRRQIERGQLTKSNGLVS